MGNKRKNTDGSLYYDKSANRWRCQFRVFDPKTSKEVRKVKSFRTEQEAKDFFSTIQYQKGNKLYVENNGIPLNLLIRANAEKKHESGLIKNRQYLRIMQTIKMMEKSPLFSRNIDEISSADIQAYLFSLKKDYSNSSIKKVMEQIKQAYKVAMNKGYIKENPLIDVVTPKSSKPDRVIRALDLDEQQVLTNYLMNIPVKDEPYKVAFLMEMFLGIRIGECLALSKKDINLKRNLINIQHSVNVDDDGNLIIGDTKTPAAEREIPIPEFLKELIAYQMKLAEYHKDNLLFVDKNGNIVNPVNANQQLQTSAKKLGIDDITTHSLRHTYGTRCIEAGMRPVALQRLMGHTDISVTLNIYTTIFNKYKEQELEKVNSYYINNSILPNSLTLDNVEKDEEELEYE